MKSQNSAIGRSHVVWLDVVRFVAMFTVVCCHSADPFNFYPGEPPANIDQIKFWGAAYGSFLRPCVPLFVMITGALLLPLKDDTSVFYKKRISRVFWPFLIWSVLYNRTARLVTGGDLGLFSLFGRRSGSSVIGCFLEIYCGDPIEFLDCRCAYVVYLSIDRVILVLACFLCLGGKSL